MKDKILNFIKVIKGRVWNKTSLVSIAALLVLLLQEFGLKIDNDVVANVVNSICTLLVTMGILSESSSN